jgi:PhnB protein
MAVKPIPEGYHSVTPYLAVEGTDKLFEFVKTAFDAADVHECMRRPDGTIQHAEVKIGDSIVMLAEASGPWKPRPSTLYLYVTDVDATYQRALAAGAMSLMEPATQFYGDRSGGVQDPAGNFWWIATHVEDVSPEELQRRAAAQQNQPH